jgi:hypothetical protein
MLVPISEVCSVSKVMLGSRLGSLGLIGNVGLITWFAGRAFRKILYIELECVTSELI